MQGDASGEGLELRKRQLLMLLESSRKQTFSTLTLETDIWSVILDSEHVCFLPQR